MGDSAHPPTDGSAGARPWREAVLASTVLLFLVASCTETPLASGPPEGWSASGARWWRTDQDSARLFRNLDSFNDMDVEVRPVVFGAGHLTVKQQVVSAVQRRLLPLYRTNPNIVDSLFHRFAVPSLEKTAAALADPERQIERSLRDAYRIMARHYREPRAVSQIGVDIPLASPPDSLQGVSGTVRMQVSIDTLGVTNSVELLEGVHPVLNGMAMRSTAMMRWSPAYLHGKPVASWARFRLSFGGPNAK